MPDDAARIRLAVVTGAHGLKGWVKIRSFTDRPAAFVEYGPLTDATGATRYTVTLKGEMKGQPLAQIAGVADRNAAEAMRGTEFFAARDALPATEDDEFLIDDLIGLDVYLADGTLYGRVHAAHDFGAGDLLELAPAQGGRSEFYSFTEANFPDIDPGAKRLTFHPPEILGGDVRESDAPDA